MVKVSQCRTLRRALRHRAPAVVAVIVAASYVGTRELHQVAIGSPTTTVGLSVLLNACREEEAI